MPRGNRTGPLGMGSMTGRAGGYCAGYGMPGYLNPVPVQYLGGWCRGGRGGFRGGGRGWRHWYQSTGLPGWIARTAVPPAWPDPDAERHLLEGETKVLQSQLEEIKNRLDELAAQKSAEV